MPPVSLNYVAMLAVVIVSMALGAVWYSPLLFGKIWMKHMGLHEKNKEEMEKMKKEAGPAYAGTIITSFVMAYVMSHFVDYLQITTAMAGAITGFWLWIGFVATASLSGYLFEKKHLALYLINNGFNLVNMTLAGAILAVWV